MKVELVSQVLGAHGLTQPTISALDPSDVNYTALLMQPRGEIEADADGVRSRDRDLATRQFEGFLRDAIEVEADLAITPEYSMPWAVLIGAIRDKKRPKPGKLWVLGCESISFAGLESLKEECAPFATMIYENCPPSHGRFLDPLAYVFLTSNTSTGAEDILVMLVQFKTQPMGDDQHFEINGLQRGSRIYQFGNAGNSLRLFSFICSDAFALQDTDAKKLYDRSLAIHIQLNPQPRHEQYRRYRDKLLNFSGDATELICLNWASDVQEWCQNKRSCWNNIAGTAWYLRPDKFDDSDEKLALNHRRGLYYTWLKTLRFHALFFNYDPATFLLNCTKVAHIGVPSAISRRLGPLLLRRRMWDEERGAWEEVETAEDGFVKIVDEAAGAREQLQNIAKVNPIAVERLAALCAGSIEKDLDWYKVRKLDSCAIDASEVIRRLTFCQDTNEEAKRFKIGRLKRCAHLWRILTAGSGLPPSLTSLKMPMRLDWSSKFPLQNVISACETRATVVYMGEDCCDEQIEATAKWLSESLRVTVEGCDESHNARQRLVVWSLREGKLVLCNSHQHVQFDEVSRQSEFDIARER